VLKGNNKKALKNNQNEKNFNNYGMNKIEINQNKPKNTIKKTPN
jgi:hypothetical protein